MTQFLTQDGPIPPYMAFPRFLLDKDGLNETAKILYTILLDRARLSQKKMVGLMNKVVCSFSSPSRIWQKQCTKVKCPLRPHYLLCKKTI